MMQKISYNHPFIFQKQTYKNKSTQKACSQKWIARSSARDFDTEEGMGSKEYFVFLEISYRATGAKDPLRGGKTFQEYAQVKRERGEFFIHPAVAPVSRMSAL